MDIAVLSGGNGAHAAAADLSELGHRVRFWRRDAAAIDALKGACNRIALKDCRGRREVEIAVVTRDMGEALRGAELIVCPAPAFAQADIARAMAPHVADGQVVLLTPGTFGSYAMAQALREAGSAARVAFAETGTLPYLARKHGPREVAITVHATRLPTGVFPLAEKERVLRIVCQAYPAVEDAGDALSGALMNAGPIIHPPLILMNAGPLEHFDRWDIHKEGTQASIRRVTDALDAERVAIREALGYGPPHFPLADHYREDGDEWMYGRKAHAPLVKSGDWREHIVLTEHRYMREDVAEGLAFLVSVADWAGVCAVSLDDWGAVRAPVARGLLALGSAVCGRDLRVTGRTLENLRLADLGRAGMVELLAEGLR